MNTFDKKQTNWEGLWYQKNGQYFQSAVIDLSKLKDFKGTVRLFVRKNKFYNNGENSRPNYVFCIRDAKSDYAEEIEIEDIENDSDERLYTEEEVRRCIHGACEDGRRGYDPYDCIIEDYI